MNDTTIVVAISGASGVVYSIRLIKALIDAKINLMIILSDAGIKVLTHEMGFDANQSFSQFLKSNKIKIDQDTRIDVYLQNEIAAPSASGSFIHSGMVVVPCSMKTLAAIAAGYADNLITRSADVCLKEERPLILVPRETPYNLIHLENMVRLKKAGAIVLPPNPSFYQFPKTIDDLVDTVVARILDHLKVSHQILSRWGD